MTVTHPCGRRSEGLWTRTVTSVQGDRVTRAHRRIVLAITVLDDVDIRLDERGPVLPPARIDGDPICIGWNEIIEAVGIAAPDGELARDRVRRWLAIRRTLASLSGRRALRRMRPLALPVSHILHPGPSWPYRRVLGGALDVGLGISVDHTGPLPADPLSFVPVPMGLARAAGLAVPQVLAHAEAHLRAMAQLAAIRVRLAPFAPLRPLGDCDVLTFLSVPHFRAALLAREHSGMRTAAVPMRSRGWMDLGRVDPAFALAAAAATGSIARGFARPVLITRDEIALARPGENAVKHALADPAAEDPWEPVSRQA